MTTGWGRIGWGQGPWGTGTYEIVSLTSVSAIGTLGALVVTGKASVPLTGVSTTVTLGTITVQPSLAVPVTGVFTTGTLGSLLVSADASVALTGEEATTELGDVTPTIGIQITGVVRPSDIKSDNTVTSDKIYDLQVSIVGEGPMSRAQQEGWLGKLLDVLWPF